MNFKTSFSIPGAPRTKGSWRFLGRGRVVSDNPASTTWEEKVRIFGVKARQQMILHDGFKVQDFQERYAVEIELTFILPRPPSHLTVKGALRPGVNPEPIGADSGDLDKYVRGVLDGLAGVFYRNDAQVVRMRASKICADSPGLEVIISSRND